MKNDKYIYKKGDIDFILCFRCVNKYRDKIGCNAFPDKIPDDILTGEFDHTVKHPLQMNDIVFEPIKGEEK